jgi:hypothetical protein
MNIRGCSKMTKLGINDDVYSIQHLSYNIQLNA